MKSLLVTDGVKDFSSVQTAVVMNVLVCSAERATTAATTVVSDWYFVVAI